MNPASKIITEYNPKPIPLRRWDWVAAREDEDGGDGFHVGYGATEAEAIADLLELEAEHAA